jgi:zinc protease
MRRRVAAALCVAACGAPQPAATQAHAAASLPTTDETFRATAPVMGPEIPFDAPVLQEKRLANGVRLLFAPYSTTVFGMRVIARGKAWYPRFKPGEMQVMSNAIFVGTPTHSEDGIRRVLDNAIADWSFGVEVDTATITVRTLGRPNNTDPVIDVVADAVQYATLTQHAVDYYLGPIAASAHAWRDNQAVVAYTTFASVLCGDASPYAQPWTAGVNDQTKLTVKAIQDMHDTVFAPSSTSVLAVGAVDDRVVGVLEHAFGSWTSNVKKPVAPVVTARLPRVRLVVVNRPNAPRSQVAFGAVGPGREATDGFALMVINELLGARPSSRFNVLQQKSSMGWTGHTVIYPHIGMSLFAFEGSVATAHTAQLLSEMDNQFATLRTEDVPQLEIEGVKTDILRRVPSWFEDALSSLNAFAVVPALELPLDTYTHLFASFRSVDPADIRKIATARFAADRLLAVVVGDWAALKPSLTKLGWSMEVEDR